jgi:toxin ParE1/3/4
MPSYKLSEDTVADLKRIYQFGVSKFGMTQADKYYYSFFENFELIAQRPLSFESVDYIKPGYRRCPCGSDSIYYRIVNNTVEIMAIIGKQDVENIFS